MTERPSKFAYLKLLHGAKLTYAEYRVLVTMWDYSNEKLESIYPGIDQLAEDVCMDRRSVRRALASLREKGYARIAVPSYWKNGRRMADEYALTLPAAEGSGLSGPEVRTEESGSADRDAPPTDHVPNPPSDPLSAPRATSSEDEDAPAARTPISDQGALGVLYDLTRHMLRAETQDEYDRRVETMTTYVEDHFICETPPGHLYWNTGWDDDLRRKIGKLGVQRAIPAWCRAFVNHAQAGITYAA